MVQGAEGLRGLQDLGDCGAPEQKPCHDEGLGHERLRG